MVKRTLPTHTHTNIDRILRCKWFTTYEKLMNIWEKETVVWWKPTICCRFFHLCQKRFQISFLVFRHHFDIRSIRIFVFSFCPNKSNDLLTKPQTQLKLALNHDWSLWKTMAKHIKNTNKHWALHHLLVWEHHYNCVCVFCIYRCNWRALKNKAHIYESFVMSWSLN